MTSNSDSPEGVDWERVAYVEIHPLRVLILEALAMDGGRTLAPNEMAYELQTDITNVNYHTTALCKAGLLRLAHERQVRGTMEHFYCLPDHSAADLFERLNLPHDSDVVEKRIDLVGSPPGTL